MQEKGDLQELYTKWWQKEGVSPEKKCDNADDKKKDSANELNWSTIGGIFLIMYSGLVMAIVVSIVEYVWRTRQSLTLDQVYIIFILRIFLKFNYFYYKYFKIKMSLRKRLVRDLKFAVCDTKTHKKVNLVRNLSLDNTLTIVEIDPVHNKQSIAAAAAAASSSLSSATNNSITNNPSSAAVALTTARNRTTISNRISNKNYV